MIKSNVFRFVYMGLVALFIASVTLQTPLSLLLDVIALAGVGLFTTLFIIDNNKAKTINAVVPILWSGMAVYILFQVTSILSNTIFYGPTLWGIMSDLVTGFVMVTLLYHRTSIVKSTIRIAKNLTQKGKQ